MKPALFGLVSLMGCHAEAPPARADVPANPTEAAFVTQCAFDNGVRIILAHRFASDSYRFIIRRNSDNELSTIRQGPDGLEIETNGGVGKILAVEKLIHWLMGQPFEAVRPEAFEAALDKKGVAKCPGPYPFSP